MRGFLFSIMALITLGFLSFSAGESLAQDAINSTDPENEVVLTKLSPPAYPPIARSAHISGDVELMLEIRRDGSIQSATVVSGPEMLKKPALDSSQQSHFECRGCSESVVPYRLTYTFKLIDPNVDANGCRPIEPHPDATLSLNHVTLTDRAVFTCDPAARRVRSSKCLYLWRCGTR